MSLSEILTNIYDNIFSFNNTNIIILFDKDNTLWLSYNDILKSLGYTDIKKLKKRLNIDDEFFCSYEKLYPQSKLNKIKLDYQKPNEKFISESGIYLLLSQSSKDGAKQLSKILFTKVLPELRKNGKFILNTNEKKNMNALTKKLKLYQKELNKTKKHTYSNNTGNGFIYILKVNTVHNGTEKICYKIGYTANLEKRLQTYKTGNPDVELVYHENLKCNKKMLEKCIKNLNTLKLLKAKSEIICDVSLEKLKTEIQDCKNLLEKHNA